MEEDKKIAKCQSGERGRSLDYSKQGVPGARYAGLRPRLLQPDQPARAYLAVIARDPEHVRRALERQVP